MGVGGTGIAVLLLLIAFGFTPSLVAVGRSHRNTAAILVANIIVMCFGILVPPLLLIWLGLLVWSFSANTRPPDVQPA